MLRDCDQCGQDRNLKPSKHDLRKALEEATEEMKTMPLDLPAHPEEDQKGLPEELRALIQKGNGQQDDESSVSSEHESSSDDEEPSKAPRGSKTKQKCEETEPEQDNEEDPCEEEEDSDPESDSSLSLSSVNSSDLKALRTKRKPAANTKKGPKRKAMKKK
jgi:hypothetical protein